MIEPEGSLKSSLVLLIIDLKELGLFLLLSSHFYSKADLVLALCINWTSLCFLTIVVSDRNPQSISRGISELLLELDSLCDLLELLVRDEISELFQCSGTTGRDIHLFLILEVIVWIYLHTIFQLNYEYISLFLLTIYFR